MIPIIVFLLSIFNLESKAQQTCPEKPCINLCCPHGYADTLVEVEKRHRCDSDIPVMKTCIKHKEEDLNWEGNWWVNDKKYGIVKKENFYGSPFECKGNTKLVAAEDLFGPNQLRLQLEGNHQFEFQGKDGLQTEMLNASDFCLSFTKIKTNYSDHDSIYPLFVVCTGTDINEAEKFTSIFYPVLIFISCLFTLLTLLAYIAIEDLRSNLFGKLVIGFLINVFINYFFNGIHYYLDTQESKYYLNTPFCVFLGYITHHSFISFFFWMNAMAVNIAYKFSNLLTTHMEENHDINLILTIIYAQGLPLVITFVIAIVDKFGSCNSILPNMGLYSCFIGSQFDPDESFLETSNFYYYYLIVMVIVICNTLCFFITGYFLTINWSTVRNMQTSNRDDNIITHVLLVTKISVIMGVPWILDVISAATAQSQGHSKTVWSRLLLDIVNLLAGVLIFTILVCKKSVWNKLKRKMLVSSTLTEDYELNTS